MCDTARMFLRATLRQKDGKAHRYWSIVENRRVRGGRTVQQPVLYLGEINDAQPASWCRTIELAADGRSVVVAASIGVDLDLVPAAADARLAHAPDARLVLALPQRDALAVTRRLAPLAGDQFPAAQ